MTGAQTTNISEMMTHPRRLSYYNLETRDAYFTRLKTKIENMVKHNKQKAVLCSHSCVKHKYEEV